MISNDQYSRILDELDNCKRPLFFFHDDADGLASFLLLYRYKREGKGVCVKSHPRVDDRFFKVTHEFEPDKIFILDIAILEQDFVDEFRKLPIVWIDHHAPLERPGVMYFNSKLDDPSDITCVSHHCYQVVKEHRPEDLWIAAMGVIGDWQLTSVTKEFSEKYPALLPPEIDRPEQALFGSPYSKMIKICEFILKGKTQEVMRCVKILTRIGSPQELLEGRSSQALFLLKRFHKIEELYSQLLEHALKQVTKSKLLLVTYRENKMSFSTELSNELLFRYPDKVILVAREKSGEMKCSLRTSPGLSLPKTLENALQGISGSGGGHECACGAVVKVEDFKQFVKQLKEVIKQ
ncbi:DHH family phosphoesterase [Candidatus Woesearchaeota archaeon]|nr:DHH family phosphoesterase [Candidatus Woesearchaeota archaeon]